MDLLQLDQCDVLNSVSSAVSSMLIQGGKIESDADETLIVNFGFRQPTRVEAIEFKIESLTTAPKEIHLFAGRTMDFDDVDDVRPTQIFHMAEGDYGRPSEPIRLLVNGDRFNNMARMSIYIPSNIGEEEHTVIMGLNIRARGKTGLDLSKGLEKC